MIYSFIFAFLISIIMYYYLTFTNTNLNSIYILSDIQQLESKLELKYNSKTDHHQYKYFTQQSLIFITPWNPQGYTYLLQFSFKFQYVSPVWYEYQSNNIQGQENTSWLEKIKFSNPNIKILPRLYIDLQPQQISQLIQKNTEFLKSIYSIYKKYDGIVFDCPYLSYMDRYSISGFPKLLQKMKDALKQQNPQFVFFITMFPPSQHSNDQKQLYKSIAKIADQLLIQSYSQQHQQYAEQVLVPISNFKELIDFYQDIPKVMFGLPFYGFKNQKGKLEHIKGIDLLNCDPNNYHSEWDEECEECFYKKKGEVLTYPCPRFLKNRLDLLNKHERGVFIWEGGQGLQQMFDLF